MQFRKSTYKLEGPHKHVNIGAPATDSSCSIYLLRRVGTCSRPRTPGAALLIVSYKGFISVTWLMLTEVCNVVEYLRQCCRTSITQKTKCRSLLEVRIYTLPTNTTLKEASFVRPLRRRFVKRRRHASRTAASTYRRSITPVPSRPLEEPFGDTRRSVEVRACLLASVCDRAKQRLMRCFKYDEV